MTEFKRIRIAAGLSQAELARKLKVDRSTVCRWDAGDSKPEPRHIPKIAKLVEKSAEFLTELFFNPEPLAATG